MISLRLWLKDRIEPSWVYIFTKGAMYRMRHEEVSSNTHRQRIKAFNIMVVESMEYKILKSIMPSSNLNMIIHTKFHNSTPTCCKNMVFKELTEYLYFKTVRNKNTAKHWVDFHIINNQTHANLILITSCWLCSVDQKVKEMKEDNLLLHWKIHVTTTKKKVRTNFLSRELKFTVPKGRNLERK